MDIRDVLLNSTTGRAMLPAETYHDRKRRYEVGMMAGWEITRLEGELREAYHLHGSRKCRYVINNIRGEIHVMLHDLLNFSFND